MTITAERSNPKLAIDTSINGLALLSDRPTLQTHTHKELTHASPYKIHSQTYSPSKLCLLSHLRQHVRYDVLLWHALCHAWGVTYMLGVSRRDRYARRADKVWRSRWLWNLQQRKHPKPLDNLAWMADSYGTSTVGPSDTSTSRQPSKKES